VTTNSDFSRLILVLEDIEEIRDGIEKLLHGDGYRVEPARSVEEAILKATRQPPDLLLVSVAGSTAEVIQVAQEIRQEAGLAEEVPIVIFSIKEVIEGEEMAIGHNVYLTKPDNFNQLILFLRRLLLVEPYPQPSNRAYSDLTTS
jgi:two-component system KDP operon response regulator KdpE